MRGITLDGRLYRVRVVYNTMERHFALQSGVNESTMLSGRHERDLLGTSYSYQMAIEPDPIRPGDYDAFYEAVSAPADSHTVTMPYGQGQITFDAEIQDGSDTSAGMVAGVRRWHGLKLTFSPISPQRRPD